MSDDQFTQLSRQFQNMQKEFSQQFLKLYKYMTKEFADVRTELATKADKKQIDAIHKLLNDHL